MRIAIMQPYLFPYLGYYQLADAADLFVIYDDVAFSKGCWINRNRLLDPAAGEPFWLTVPVREAGPHRRIDELEIGGPARWRDKLLRRVEAAYRHAPYFRAAWPLVESALSNRETNLALFLESALRDSCRYLGIGTALQGGSARYSNRELGAAGRLIDIARREGAGEYLNPEGGRELYDPAQFDAAGVRLRFVDHVERPYPQCGTEFVPRLSVIDALMHNSERSLRELLASYEIH